jgi:DNA modification methylase
MNERLKTVLSRLSTPFYETEHGAAYVGDAIDLLRLIPSSQIDLIMTSPPFALQRKKEYGNPAPEEYVNWFLPFADEFWRVLKEEGSLVIHIGGSWQKGKPVRALYHIELLMRLCERFYLAQEFYWFNPSKLPTPAEWVTVRRIRAKDAVDPVWWLSKSPFPKANNRNVLKEYSSSMLELLEKGYRAKLRPSGHNISTKFQRNLGGAIPPNLLIIPNTDSNSYYFKACKSAGLKPNPARYPTKLPEFFIRFLTEENDVVLDPFGGSNATGEAAERWGRSWICFEINEEYLKGSRFRFKQEQLL